LVYDSFAKLIPFDRRLDERQLAQVFTPVFDELAFKMKAVTLMGSFVPLFRVGRTKLLNSALLTFFAYYKVFALLMKSKPIANLVSPVSKLFLFK